MRPSRRSLLQGMLTSAVLGPIPLRALAGRRSGARKLIVIYADGGWDTSYVIDPKQDSDEVEGPERHEDPENPEDREALRTSNGITYQSNPFKRPGVDGFFDTWGDRVSIVNGLWIGNIAHNECRYRMLTGTPLNVNPDYSVITGWQHGQDLPLGQVDLSGFSLVGDLGASTGRVGSRSQLKTLIDPASALKSGHPDISYPQFAPTEVQEDAVRALLRDRAERLRTARGEPLIADLQIDQLLESLDRAERVRKESFGIAQQLELGREPTFTTEMEVALDLLEQEVCHSVMIEASAVFDDLWDTHDDNFPQHELWDGLFARLADLCRSLTDRGMLDDTLVVVTSEMARTPKYNEDGGKDHWGHTSAMVLGGGLTGGRVLGGTDDLAESLAMDLSTGAVDPAGDLCKYDNWVAGLLELMDVDPEAWLPGVVPFRGLQT